jgi:hypothetical protein
MKKFLLPTFVLFLLAIAAVAFCLVSTDSVVTIQNGKAVRETVAAVGAAASTAADPLTGKSVTATEGNITATAKTNGNNAGLKNEFVGLPRIKLVRLGTGTNGAASGKTLILTDDTPDGEWAAVDSGTTVTADTTYFKIGAKSLKTLFKTTATVASGVHATESNIDFTDDEYVGMWLYSTKVLAAGDLVLKITDSVAGVTSTNIPAVATANKWTWVEVDISAVANASKDVITDVSITLSAAGVVKSTAGAFSVYVDEMVKWDSTEEITLGSAILQDGVLGVMGLTYTTGTYIATMTVVNSAGNDVTSVTSTNGTALATLTGASLVEGTDYLVAYRTGNDVLVCITDLSKTVMSTLIAY